MLVEESYVLLVKYSIILLLLFEKIGIEIKVDRYNTVIL